MILFPLPVRPRQHGVALITVLLMMALLLTFMVAVYTLSDNELKGATRYANIQEARQLGDLAVNVAISQVRKGSTPNAKVEGREAWISQPGMIRQYSANGNFLAGYKLYSSSRMVTPGGAAAETALTNDSPPEDWLEFPARYVDLNRPIVHANAAGAPALSFPIIDPRAMTGGTDTVSGFSYTTKLSNGKTLSGVRTTGGDSQRVPMPVEWLYVLKDGNFGTLNPSNQFEGPVQPDAENPIVGRIAFWADDESSKVNINTASEPTPWAVPTFFHEDDSKYARYQPVGGEFQRYPGHPATTALSPILFPNKTLSAVDKDLIYNLVPKIGPGGTHGGTISYKDPAIAQIQLAAFRKERLYANLDEFLLREDRLQNNFGLDVVPEQVLSRKAFFLTANSRSPELNPFGQPKVALWPINYRGADYGTSFDQLVAFCSTLRQSGSGGVRKYIFQRGNADSPTTDVSRTENQALLSYLNRLLSNPLPGISSGPEKTFANKYGDDLPQILVEIFDYIRGTNLHDGNIVQDPRVVTPGAGGDASQNFLLGYATTGEGRKFQFKTFTDPRFFTADPEDETGSAAIESLGFPGHGQVTPSRWTVGGKSYQGIGRFPTVSEVGLHFICAADNTDDPNNPYVENYANIGKPGGGSAPTLDGKTPQARWYSNFPPLPKPNPAKNEKANLTLYPKTGGFPYGPDVNHPGYQNYNWNHQLTANTPLKPGFRRVQSRVLLEFFTPAAGFTLIEPEFTVRVTGLKTFSVNGQPLFPNDKEVLYTGRRATHTGNQMSGGYGLGVKGILRAREAPARTPMPADVNWGNPEWEVKPSAGTSTERSVLDYNLLSNFIDIEVGRDGLSPMQVSQGTITIELFSGHLDRLVSSGDTAPALVQTFKLRFPANNVAAPTLVRNPIAASGAQPAAEAPSWWTFYTRGALGIKNRDEIVTRSMLGPVSFQGDVTLGTGEWTKRMRGRYFGTSVAARVGNEPRKGAFFYGFDSETVPARNRLFRPKNATSVAEAEKLEGSDVVQSLTIRHGDYRLTAALPVVDVDQWEPARQYGKSRLAHTFTNYASNDMPGYDYGTAAEQSQRLAPTPNTSTYSPARVPDLPLFSAATESAQRYGDFDNGPGPARDGPYINKPDEGNVNAVTNGVAYFSEAGQHTTIDEVFFTPNRLISSPVVLGSLPTGVKSGNAWRTLLFRPQSNHPGGPASLGGKDPADHNLLEFFWMPVVEPYAISEPFSTAGKVNLNYQILPFTHIRRASALHAVFAGEGITAIPTDDAPNYKVFPDNNDQEKFWTTEGGQRWHYKIDAEKTLAQFEQRFRTGHAFVSPSEICDVELVPDRDVEGYTGMDAFWAKRRLTGDNTRERPYAGIYPRVTTRSNSFRVHYIAQAIRKARSSSVNAIEATDQFVSEYRGSSVIERFLDPAQAGLPDFTAAASAAETLDSSYQFRVLETRKFGN